MFVAVQTRHCEKSCTVYQKVTGRAQGRPNSPVFSRIGHAGEQIHRFGIKLRLSV